MDDLIEKIRKRLAHASNGERAYERPMTWDEADKAMEEIQRLRAIVAHVETWISNPPASYSMMALDGLFSQTRAMINPQPTE